MNTQSALAALSALAQESRLAVFRLLIQAGPDGLAASKIAEQLDIAPSSLSFHLKELERANLIAQRRQARSIIYAANYDGLRSLIGFLMKDCCGGRPEICAPIFEGANCKPPTKRSRVHA